MIMGMGADDSILAEMLHEIVKAKEERRMLRRLEVSPHLWNVIRDRSRIVVDHRTSFFTPHGVLGGVMVRMRMDLEYSEWAVVYRA